MCRAFTLSSVPSSRRPHPHKPCAKQQAISCSTSAASFIPLPQGLQRFALGLAHQGGQPRQPLQTIGQGDQIAGGGAAGSGSAGQPLEIAHRPQQPPVRSLATAAA